MLDLVHIVAVNTPWFAVFAKEDGTPEFRPVACLGTMQTPGDNPTRVLGGFCLSGPEDLDKRGGSHLLAADWMRGFVGYSTDTLPDPWLERCKVVREKLAEADVAAAHQKIIVPGGDKKIFH
jgi:hypothetical protein